jgi:hypothetical protein
MTTIKNIVDMPPGTKTGGYEFTVKTAKKKWEVKGEWFQQLTLTDGRFDILAELQLNGNVGIQRNTPIRVIVAERDTRNVNNRDVPCLHIYEWADARPKMTEPEDDYANWQVKREEHEQKIWRCAMLKVFRRVTGYDEPLSQTDQRLIARDVDFIRTGE